MDKKMNKWRNVFKGIVKIGRYDDLKWFNKALKIADNGDNFGVPHYECRGDKPENMKWFLFHVEAYKQRSYIRDRIRKDLD